MVFKFSPPKWNNAGVEPQEQLKTDGFQAGYKPPAAYFNWFFHGAYECLKELQGKAVELDNKKMIVVTEKDIPVAERKPNTFYFRISDHQAITTTDTIKVSPNMGLKIL